MKTKILADFQICISVPLNLILVDSVKVPSRLLNLFEFGNGSRISDEKPVVLELKYLQNKKW